MRVEAGPCLISPTLSNAENKDSIFSRLSCLLLPKKHAQPAPPLAPSTSDGRFEEFRGLISFGDGKISPTELQNCMRIVGEDLSVEDAEAVVESIDSDGDGQLCFDEVIELAKPERKARRRRGDTCWRHLEYTKWMGRDASRRRV